MHVGMKHAWMSQACADQCMQTWQLWNYNYIRFDSGLIGFSAGKSGKKVSFNSNLFTVALIIHVFKQPTIIKYKCIFHPVNKLS